MSTEAPRSQPRWPPRWLAPTYGLVFAAAVVTFLLSHVRLENHFFDLMVYRSAMQWWSDGHPLYDYSQPDETQGSLGFTYPPVGAFLLRPLAYLSRPGTIAVYIIVAVACLAASVWWLTRAVARRHGWSRPALFVVCLVLTAGVGAVWIGFDFGQINPVLWALVVLDLAVLAPRGSRFLGVGIGLATAIKLVPGIFIVYLLLSRRWRGTIVATATTALSTFAAFLAAPADSRRYWTSIVWGGDGVGHLWFFMNQSISGVLARLYMPANYPAWLWLLLCLPVLVFGMWRARRAALAGDELTGFALAGFVASLISPVTWAHHIFYWVPGLLAMADTGLARRSGEAVSAVRSGLRHPAPLFAVTLVVYPIVAVNAVSHPETGLINILMGNWLVWLMLLLLVVLPIDTERATADLEAIGRAAVPRVLAT